MRRILGAVGAGALAAWFLDPQLGRRRRELTVDRVRGFLHRRARRTARLARAAAARAHGVEQKALHRRAAGKGELDDQTLKAKVETEIFRPADVPKGQIDVNAENGIVVLRGEVPRPELVGELEEQVRRIQGVRDVENLLHLPGTEPQMHQAHRASD